MENLKKIVDELNLRNAENMAIYDLRHKSPFVDWMIICEANNLRLLHALAQYVIDVLDKYDIAHKPIEGKHNSTWLLIDCKDVVVHLFLNTEREQVALDKLYHESYVSEIL